MRGGGARFISEQKHPNLGTKVFLIYISCFALDFPSFKCYWVAFLKSLEGGGVPPLNPPGGFEGPAAPSVSAPAYLVNIVLMNDLI